jgi:two-component system response regulator PilR (NtrC family)
MTEIAQTGAVLVVDDEPDLLTLYELSLLREGYEVETAGSVAEAWSALQSRRFRLLITDMRLPDGLGLSLMQRLEAAGRTEKVIVITAYGSAENAVEALKAGAFDYLTKPVDLRQFRSVVSAAMGRSAAGGASQASAAPVPRSNALERLVGDSRAMCEVRSLVQKVARSMAPVLVHGESGTGKELVACAIHEVSSRSAQPFVPVNCGAIPENLLESEFFGYRKGAFTGANEDRAGFFQAANGGTLFLDEIGDLPLIMQAKLLRVIQERAVRPVGAVAEVALNVRIVSATHKDLAQEVAAGRFRQDLFYRLNVIGITVPALRERYEDLPVLATALLKRLAQEAGLAQPPRLSATALGALRQYAFPGNVRELENLLHRAMALSGNELIEAPDLGLAPSALTPPPAALDFLLPTAELPQLPVLDLPATLTPEAVPVPFWGEASAAATAPTPVALAAPSVPASVAMTSAQDGLPASLELHLDEVERGILVRALQEYGFNRTAAGQRLGLTLRQIRYRMARLGITAHECADDSAGE